MMIEIAVSCSTRKDIFCKMGKLNIFEITLSNLQGVYYAGQNVQGHCTVELNEEMSMRGIRLKFEGKAYVHWTESKSSGSGSKSYTATEKYFEQEVLLFGIWPGQGSDTTKLAAGRTTFQFCFVLPPNLPSSFEGTHGYVRYFVKATIDKPWKFDHTTKRPFTIIGILDLNTDANAVIPVEGVNQKTLCCLCCASGPISASFHLERRGYVPGEPIKLLANIKNKSNQKMDKSFVDLRMTITYYARTKNRTSVKEVGRVLEGPIEEGQSFSWEGQVFVLPPLPPSHLAGCRIIDVKYILQLNVEPSGMSLNLEVPLEIIIGTIPLRQVVELCPPRAPQPFQPPVGFPLPTEAVNISGMDGGSVIPSAPFEPVMPYQPPSHIPNLPPPSYSECVLGKVNVKDEDDNEYTHGVLEYAPVYTYYDWGYQPTAMK
ncbi:arrestin domain-containing protein 3-like isoform X2 [Pomacea canaliculata]|uniref:arrestin domain-containing protein 3-like isoform X2 n=1 Tax=Pomacea canaliculata TaxID=400727 RepID=UPI000D73E610|nr:arrestin domain-containing protein 3-like isoform X2 [Pomacea canaliculata]